MRNISKANEERLISAERIYGKLPERPQHLSCRKISVDESFAAGKATLCQCELLLDLVEREISLPFISVIPKCGAPMPAIAYLSYEKNIPNKYLPAEEIIDRGYAIFSMCIDDLTCNSPDFKSGIGKNIAPSRRKRLSPGKIALWAWAALRLTEYVCDLEFIDRERIAIAGHGILARAAMLASGNSEKSTFLIANCMAEDPTPFTEKCEKSGLTVRDFSYLYSPAFADEPDADELDVLLEITADKTMLLGFSEESDCVPEYNYIHKMRHYDSISTYPEAENEQNKIPAAPICINDGDLSYHIRCGSDYFSREDWNIYLDFIDKKA